LAALGALRGGAGLVCAAVPRSERPLVAVAVPEALTLPLPDDDDGRPAAGAAAVLRTMEPAPDAVVLGPGLGRAPAVTALVRDLVEHVAAPLVIDADGLNALASEPGALDQLGRGPGPRVLTPHPGEAARLLNAGTGTIQRDRPAAARALARRSGAVVLLKGARSLVAEPSGALWIVPTGSPALATGGTGDVLAGLIGALLAGGLSPVQAARAGAFLHGWAGQRLARRLGSHGLVAGDLPAAIARARAALVGTRPTGALPAAAGEDRRILEACGIFLEEGGHGA
ncbi:MAG TPA: NAD(P)H-hydrate dehydratase, partial [Bacillota bacterium]